jgi:hypothetical protein
VTLRIWDIDPGELCRNHLLGEHRELHGLWNVLTQDKTGYSRHPETRRWRGKLAALYARHEAITVEMTRRGFGHHSPLDARLATGLDRQEEYVDPPDAQQQILRDKPCTCFITQSARERDTAHAHDHEHDRGRGDR